MGSHGSPKFNWSYKNVFKMLSAEEGVELCRNILCVFKDNDKIIDALCSKISMLTKHRDVDRIFLEKQPTLILDNLNSLSNDFLERLLIGYHFEIKRPMMKQFLDIMEIDNKEGDSARKITIIDIDEELFNKAIKILNEKYNEVDIRIYLGTLLANNKNFSCVYKVLKDGIDSYLEELRLGEVQVDEAEEETNFVQEDPMEIEEQESTQQENKITSLNDLIARTKTLSDDLKGLAEEIINSASKLIDPGIPIEKKLNDEIVRTRVNFNQIRTEIVDIASHIALPTEVGEGDLSSIKDVSSALMALEDILKRRDEDEEMRNKALELIRGILSITHCDNMEFLPLNELKVRARKLSECISDAKSPLSEEAKTLIRGGHPYCDLLCFIEGEGLEDESWGKLHDNVETHFGRSLALAASRGKLSSLKSKENVPCAPTGTMDIQPLLEKASAETPVIVDISQSSASDCGIPTGGDAASLSGEGVLTVVGGREQGDPHHPEDKTEKGEIKSFREGEIPSSPEVSQEGLSEFSNLSTLSSHPAYNFAPTVEAREIAALAAAWEGPISDRLHVISNLVWRLAYEDQLQAAYKLARYLDTQGMDDARRLPTWLVRGIYLGRFVRHSSGPIANLLRESFSDFDEKIFHPGVNEWNMANRLLLLSATLYAALLAPETHASIILHSLHLKEGGTNNLDQYCKAVAGYSDKLIPLDPNAIKRLKDQASWDADVLTLQQKVDNWYKDAHLLPMSYIPASKVWKKWLSPGGVVHALLTPVRQNNSTQATWVRDEVSRLTDDSEFKRAVVFTDRKIIGRTHGGEIDSRAIDRIKVRFSEVLEFTRQWLLLQENHPGRSSKEYEQKRANELRRDILERHDAVLAQLSGMESHETSIYVLAGISCCRKILEIIARLFDPEVPFPSDEETDPRQLLQSDLLLIPEVLLDEQWEPEGGYTDTVIEYVLRQIAGDPGDWRLAFKARAAQGDHEGTRRIIDYLRKNPIANLSLESLKKERLAGLKDSQAALQRALQQTKKEVENAVALGLLNESDRGKHLEVIARIERESGETEAFRKRHEELSNVQKEIEGRQREEVVSARHMLEAAEIDPASADYTRIGRLLDKGDVLTANEYIHLAQQGRPLPEEGSRVDVFEDFFPQRFREIEKLILGSPKTGKLDINGVIRDFRLFDKGLRQQLSVGSLVLNRLEPGVAEQAALLLETWFTALRVKRIEERQVKVILEKLGFSPSNVSIKSGRRTLVKVTTDPIRDRDYCPVARYGSEAGGRYQILCVWDNPLEDKLLHDIREMGHGEPLLVFYFGLLTEAVRRDLAQVCRERRKTFIVIDDAVILYLCMEARSRLAGLFGITLPFTFLEPYTTTAGLVPPEMFYGRKRERASIVDPMGSCFIFGGRQLGKTALLRDVERTFHKPEMGVVVRWLDIKAAGIGVDRVLDDFWFLLARELKKQRVVPDNVPDQTGQEKLLGHVKSWLEGDERRRILLLLDEADRFLESDQKEEFKRVAALKGLMDQTNRRFKVVFSGLHNVQRTTRQQNHPLAHYGEPICIGPLLENGEFREAWGLIERPLGCLGYKMESRDLTMRILSQTNYYPSLIQLYCNYLLRYVTDSNLAGFDRKQTPPYTITSRHVEEAYRSHDLRKAIRDRFMLTLDLDPRYRVIAFAIALYSSSPGEEEGGAEGYSVSWIRKQALTFWEDGFREAPSEDSFRVLLDEMTGLGVLRVSEEGRYTLRSPNVITLIGTREEIESELLRPREIPAIYEPATFRRSAYDVNGQGESFRRSPLTAQQESELRGRKNGVSIVFGCKAADLDSLGGFLHSAFGKDFVSDAETLTDVVGFKEQLDRHARTREKGGTSLFLVSHETPWSELWVREAISLTKVLRSKNSFVRVMFLADPRTAWGLIGQNPDLLEKLASAGLTLFSLKPWHDAALRKWLEDCEFGASACDKEGRKKITTATGNWAMLLLHYYELCRYQLHKWEKLTEILDGSFSSAEEYPRLLAAFGLDLEIPRRVLHDLAQLGEAPEEDLAAIIDGIPLDMVSRSLRWADLLGLVIPGKNGAWKVDDTVARILRGEVTHQVRK